MVVSSHGSFSHGSFSHGIVALMVILSWYLNVIAVSILEGLIMDVFFKD